MSTRPIWFALAAFAAALACGVSDDTLVRVAEAAGLHDVKPNGYAPFSCSEDDEFASHFLAKNTENKIVHGTVCCGWLKDCTVRFE